MWDEDGSGLVDKKEFRMALRAHGYKAPSSELDKAYDGFVASGGGELDYRAFRRKLRPRSASTAGSAEPALKHALRHNMAGKQGAALPMGVTLDPNSGAPLSAQLRDILTQHSVRVIDLFRDWDEDGDGIVSRKEFRQALPALGISTPNFDCADQLFDEFDPDKSGQIEYKELNSLLRRRVHAK